MPNAQKLVSKYLRQEEGRAQSELGKNEGLFRVIL